MTSRSKTMKENKENKDLDKVMPSDFKITLLGKERQVKFGNLALAKIEKRYGAMDAFTQVQKDLESKPMETIPWLLSICLKDKSGLTDDYESVLSAMDESNLTPADVVNVVMSSMMTSLRGFSEQKKKVTEKAE